VSSARVYTTLPGAYRDTTKFDEPSTFVPATGVGDTSSIQPGYVYEWRRAYWAWGLYSVTGVMRHIGSITWWDSRFSPCDGTDALCRFQIDQTNIGPSSIVN